MKAGCIIFDCDGTLVDSEGICNIALSQMLREYSIQELSGALERRYRGAKLANIVSDLQDRHNVEFDPDFVVRYRHLVSEMFERDLKPIQGVRAALERIDRPMCVASSGPAEKIKQALRVTGLLDFFGANIYSSYEIQSWKPEPDLFIHAANEMGAAYDSCCVVEDSPLGVEAALRAGMQALYLKGRDAPDAADLPGVTVFDDMKDLPFLVDRCFSRS